MSVITGPQTPGSRFGFDRATPPSTKPNPYTPIPFKLPEDLGEAHAEIQRLAALLQQSKIDAHKATTFYLESEAARKEDQRDHEELLADYHRSEQEAKAEAAELKAEVAELDEKIFFLLEFLGIKPEQKVVKPLTPTIEVLPNQPAVRFDIGWRALAAEAKARKGVA